MATCSNCGNNTTKCGCKDTPLTTPPSYTCPPNDSCPDPTPCYETIQDTCVIHSLNYGLPCLGVTAGMTLEQILQVINNTLNSIGDGTLSTSDEGVLVEGSTTAMNFVGPLVTAISAGANSVTVAVNGNLVADLNDVNQNGYSTLADLVSNTTFDFLASPPSFPNNTAWAVDLLVNTVNASLYSIVYDPVTNIWRPFNIAFLINEVICTFYSQNGFLQSSRTVGLNNTTLTFTNSPQTDCKGNTSAEGSNGVIFKLADNGTTGTGSGNFTLYTNSQIRLSHLMIYQKDSATYQNYASWFAAGNPNTLEEQRALQLGRFTDAYFDNVYQSNGYQRTPARTIVEFYSNPVDTTNVGVAYATDASIYKLPDQYNIIDQATRVITGGGHLVIQRESPTSQHAGVSNIGLGSIYLINGNDLGTSPRSEFKYTGQWAWSQYGSGAFAGTTAYYLATTNSGDVIEVESSDVEQGFLTDVQPVTVTTWTVSSTNNRKLIELDNASPITLNVVLNSSLAIPVGTRVEFYQGGAGVITITPAPGVTINSRGGLLNSNGQYAKFELIKTNTDEWLASGDLA